jgi:hypothetical protein
MSCVTVKKAQVLAPNGEPSSLHKQLLDVFGDEDRAYKTWLAVNGEDFIRWYQDGGEYDENGEPILIGTSFYNNNDECQVLSKEEWVNNINSRVDEKPIDTLAFDQHNFIKETPTDYNISDLIYKIYNDFKDFPQIAPYLDRVIESVKSKFSSSFMHTGMTPSGVMQTLNEYNKEFEKLKNSKVPGLSSKAKEVKTKIRKLLGKAYKSGYVEVGFIGTISNMMDIYKDAIDGMSGNVTKEELNKLAHIVENITMSCNAFLAATNDTTNPGFDNPEFAAMRDAARVIKNNITMGATPWLKEYYVISGGDTTVENFLSVKTEAIKFRKYMLNASQSINPIVQFFKQVIDDANLALSKQYNGWIKKYTSTVESRFKEQLKNPQSYLNLFETEINGIRTGLLIERDKVPPKQLEFYDYLIDINKQCISLFGLEKFVDPRTVPRVKQSFIESMKSKGFKESMKNAFNEALFTTEESLHKQIDSIVESSLSRGGFSDELVNRTDFHGAFSTDMIHAVAINYKQALLYRNRLESIPLINLAINRVKLIPEQKEVTTPGELYGEGAKNEVLDTISPTILHFLYGNPKNKQSVALDILQSKINRGEIKKAREQYNKDLKELRESYDKKLADNQTIRNFKEKIIADKMVHEWYKQEKSNLDVRKRIALKGLKLKRLDVGKAGDFLIDWTRSLNLGFNVISAATNLLNGINANLQYAAAGLEFSYSDMSKGMLKMIYALNPKSKVAIKVRALMDHYNISSGVSEISHADSPIKSRGTLEKILDKYDKSMYHGHKIGDFQIQGQVIVAMLHKLKLDGKPLWELLDVDEHGIITFSDPRIEKILEDNVYKMKQTINAIHGNYQNDDYTPISKGIIGRLFQTFKKYQGEIIHSRLGALSWDYRLGRYTKGTLTSFKDALSGGVSSLSGSSLGRTILNTFLYTVPGLNFFMWKFGRGKEDDLDLANLRKFRAELFAFFIMFLALKALQAGVVDPENENKKKRRGRKSDADKKSYALINFFHKLDMEMFGLSILNPAEALSGIRKDPIAALKTVYDYGSAFKAGVVAAFDEEADTYQTGDKKGDSKFVTKAKKVIPVGRSIWKIIEFGDRPEDPAFRKQ